MAQPTEWVTIDEAARILGIGKRTIWRRIKSNGSERMPSCHRIDGGHRVTLVQLAAPATAGQAAIAYQEHRAMLEGTTAALIAAAETNTQHARQEVRHYRWLGTWAASAAVCLSMTTALLYGVYRAETAVAVELRTRVGGVEQDKQRLIEQLDALQTRLDQAELDQAQATVDAVIEALGGTPHERPNLGG